VKEKLAPSLRQLPDYSFRTARALQEFTRVVQRDNATRQSTEEALQKLKAQTSPEASRRAVSSLLASALKSGDVAYEPLDAKTPLILVKRPVEDRYAALVSDRRVPLKNLLEQKVENKQLTLVPLIYSSAGKERVKDLKGSYGSQVEDDESGNRLVKDLKRSYGSQVEDDESGDRLAKDLKRSYGSQVEDDESGNRLAAGPEAWRALHGKTVILVAQLVGEGKDQAQIQPDGTTIPLSQFLKASREVGFKLVPLGYETAGSSAGRTRITDLDVLDSVKAAFNKQDLITNNQDLWSALSGQKIKLIPDVSRVDENKGLIGFSEAGKDNKEHFELDANVGKPVQASTRQP
jgi:hypothetical protein